MKKSIIIISLLIFAFLAILNFATFKTVSAATVKVSDITSAKLGFLTPTMKVKYNNQVVKMDQPSDFFFVKDPVIGLPNGHFTITKKTNIFGFTKYIAHDLK